MISSLVFNRKLTTSSGPLKLKQFAAYTPGTTTARKEKREGSTARRRRHHQHLDRRARADNKKRGKIYATIDGQLVSWDDNSPTTAANAQEGAGKMVTATIDGQVQTWVNNWFGPTTPTATSQASPPASQITSQDVAAGTNPQKTRMRLIPLL